MVLSWSLLLLACCYNAHRRSQWQAITSPRRLRQSRSRRQREQRAWRTRMNGRASPRTSLLTASSSSTHRALFWATRITSRRIPCLHASRTRKLAQGQSSPSCRHPPRISDDPNSSWSRPLVTITSSLTCRRLQMNLRNPLLHHPPPVVAPTLRCGRGKWVEAGSESFPCQPTSSNLKRGSAWGNEHRPPVAALFQHSTSFGQSIASLQISKP